MAPGAVAVCPALKQYPAYAPLYLRYSLFAWDDVSTNAPDAGDCRQRICISRATSRRATCDLLQASGNDVGFHR